MLRVGGEYHAFYREVTFPNATQGIDLAGMLFLPRGDGPFPAAVVIHGSGTSSRGNAWYLTFTTYLQDHGVAVLLPDKRGSGFSGGDWRTASLEDLATDTLSAISYLRTRHGRIISNIGIVGVSQGGYIAPLVATRSDDISFIVNLVGASVPLHRALLYEESHNLRQMGLPPLLSKAVAYISFDPIAFWRQVKVPTLVLYGELDTNVPSQASAERPAALGNPNIRVTVFEGSGHALQDPGRPEGGRIRQDALQLMRDFIAEATSPVEPPAGPAQVPGSPTRVRSISGGAPRGSSAPSSHTLGTSTV
jgi:dipeptidyl aminopeptidase/acylaminoacyl peptidase